MRSPPTKMTTSVRTDNQIHLIGIPSALLFLSLILHILEYNATAIMIVLLMNIMITYPHSKFLCLIP